MNVYLIKTQKSQKYKIGIAKDVQKRVRELQTGNPEQLIIVYSHPTQYASKVETALHNHYNYLNDRGEWFKFDLCIELDFPILRKQIEDNLIFLKKHGNKFI
jgi:hypothetical protein